MCSDYLRDPLIKVCCWSDSDVETGSLFHFSEHYDIGPFMILSYLILSMRDRAWSAHWPRLPVGSVRPSPERLQHMLGAWTRAGLYYEPRRPWPLLAYQPFPLLTTPVRDSASRASHSRDELRCSAAQLLLAICVRCMLSCPKTTRSRRRVFV